MHEDLKLLFSTMMVLQGVLCFFVLVNTVKSTTVKESSVEDAFKQCLISTTPTSLGYCIGMGALSKLQSIDNDPEFDVVDGVTFARDEQQVREALNFMERDPGDFRTIVESMGQVFSRRSLKWDMGFIYPGLHMQIAPSVNPGGILEFVMDSRREVISPHTLKEAGTGRLLARQFLLPFLLGFKFNVATIIPLIFGLLAIVAKKAVFLSKIGLIISTAIGLGTLLFGGHKFTPGGGSFNPGFGGNYGQYGQYGGYGTYNRYPDDENLYSESVYRGAHAFPEVNNVRLFNEIQKPYPNSRGDKVNGGARNFAWNEAEQKAKT